jgi:HEAT repeat protein
MNTPRRKLLCAALLVAAAAAPAQKAAASAQKVEDIVKAAGPVDAAGAEKIKEFKKFQNHEDVRIRAEQHERLSLVDHPEAALILINVGMRDDTFRVRDRAIWALSKHKSAGSLAVARALLKTGSDEAKTGVARALSKMDPHPPGAAAEVAALLLAGGKETTREALCQALGFFADKVGTPALVANLKGPEKVVIAAADALGLVKDPAAVAPLVAMLKGGTWVTQVAAIDALALIRSKDSVPPLIEYLANAEGRPREDAKIALQQITGREFGMKAEDWQGWWKDNGEKWEVPPPVDPKTIEAKEKNVDDGYGRSHKVVEYHRIKTYSKRLLFVVDISASMQDVIKVKRGYDAVDKRFQASPKIDLARHELKAVLKTLDKNTWFNVMCFETDIRPWKKEAVLADPSSVADAVQWVESQRARTGGSSGGMRQSSGIDENGWVVGRTNTYGALKFVFGRPLKPGIGVTGNPKPAGNCDTVFFLTDGEPTEGETTNLDEILADVVQWNKTAKLIIHTIGMSETSGLRTLLSGLAQQTGGKCVFVGE